MKQKIPKVIKAAETYRYQSIIVCTRVLSHTHENTHIPMHMCIYSYSYPIFLHLQEMQQLRDDTNTAGSGPRYPQWQQQHSSSNTNIADFLFAWPLRQCGSRW